MFYTLGWGAVLAAGGTLGGVIVTQAANVWNKRMDAKTQRDDRQHERALDYEKRVWQAKGDVLKRLISACRSVKWVALINPADIRDENYRRALTVRALYQFRTKIGDEEGISEITAYAAEPVLKALDELLGEADAQRRKHRNQLMALQRIQAELDRADKEEPETDPSGARTEEGEKVWDRQIELGAQRGQTMENIGSRSDLDFDRVIALCDRTIDAAQKDLKGRYTE